MQTEMKNGKKILDEVVEYEGKKGFLENIKRFPF